MKVLARFAVSSDMVRSVQAGKTALRDIHVRGLTGWRGAW